MIPNLKEQYERKCFELEICAGNIQSVIAADKGGADRVELCDNLIEGGTTPSLGTISLAKDLSEIDVFPIIRPRGGDFVYDDVEQEIMLRDVKIAVEHGADGIVIGALKSDGNINYDLCCKLIEVAKGIPITFHRAFDHCRNPFDALDILLKMGVKRLLTSGQQNTAIEGADLIAELQHRAGKQLVVMAGSGVDENNINELATKTHVKAFHASLRCVYKQETVFSRNEVRFNGTKDLKENQLMVSSLERIKRVIKKLENI